MDNPDLSVSQTFYKRQPQNFYVRNQIEKHNEQATIGKKTSVVLGSYMVDSNSLRQNQSNFETINESKEIM
jgi:hypothetical protein